ncbi:MAG: hypothetical protein MI724_14900, partial [Spirochaetales bacterium]|nr:hypothetical protein [Spirochaetales bacterium]
YIPLFFREFFKRYRASIEKHSDDAPVEVRGVMIQQALGNRTARGLAKRIWSLYGAVGFCRVGVRYVWKKALRLLGPLAPTVAAHCRRAGVPLLSFPLDPGRGITRPNDANGEAFRTFLRDREIDLVVSVSASQIFKAEVLSTPPLGCINLHNAPLPHYRGMLPNFWQLYHGETHSVLTIHRMVEDLDRGDILLQEATPITPDMSLEDLIRATKRRSAAALWSLLNVSSRPVWIRARSRTRRGVTSRGPRARRCASSGGGGAGSYDRTSALRRAVAGSARLQSRRPPCGDVRRRRRLVSGGEPQGGNTARYVGISAAARGRQHAPYSGYP